MRIRTVKPEFWTNEKMAALPDFTRLVALALLNYADDHGYFWANSLMMRGALFPFEDEEISSCSIQICDPFPSNTICPRSLTR
jgi:hypothetical protein